MKHACFLFLGASLLAQELYLSPESFAVSPGERVKVGISTADLSRLKDASMYTTSGAYNMLNLRRDGAGAAVDVAIKGPGTPVLAIRTLPSVSGGKRSTEFAKALLISGGKTDDAFKRRVGHALEFVPAQNPYSLKPGATLPVHLLLRGKPAAGVQVQAIHTVGETAEAEDIGKTDSSGRILVPLTVAARWRVAATVTEPCPEPTVAEAESFTASLAFEVK